MAGRPAASRRRVALWGNFGSGNLGNEATLESIASSVRRFEPRAEISCICSLPSDTETRHRLRAVPLSPTRGEAPRERSGAATRLRRAGRRLAREASGWRRAWLEARGIDLLVVAGTGVLTDEGEGALGLPHDLVKWSLAARAAGARLAYASVGVEGVRGRLSRLFLRTALRLASDVSVRDEESRRALAALGCADRVRLYPDLAFSYPRERLPARHTALSGRLRVAVGLYDAFERGRHGGAAARAYGSYLEKMTQLVLSLLDRGHDVRLVIGDVAYDVPVLEELLARATPRAAGRCGTLSAEPARSVEQLLGQLASVDLVVATRYHNLLLGNPAIALSHQAKDDALLQAFGLGRWREPLDALDVGRVLGLVGELADASSRLRPGILGRAEALRAQLEEQYARLFAGPA